MGRVCGMFEDKRMTYRTFVGKSNGTSPPKIHSFKPRCELNKKMYLQELGRKIVNRTNLAQDRENYLDFANTPKNIGFHNMLRTPFNR
jgi:hypothetical protein